MPSHPFHRSNPVTGKKSRSWLAMHPPLFPPRVAPIPLHKHSTISPIFIRLAKRFRKSPAAVRAKLSALLTKREAHLVLGRLAHPPKTLRQLSREMHVSYSHVVQIELDALRKLGKFPVTRVVNKRSP